MVLNQIFNELDKINFLNSQVDEFIEVVEGETPEGFTEEYKEKAFNFFDRMLKEYKLREAI